MSFGLLFVFQSEPIPFTTTLTNSMKLKEGGFVFDFRLRAEKSDVLSDEELSLERKVECMKVICQNISKKVQGCLRGQGQAGDVEKRLVSIGRLTQLSFLFTIQFAHCVPWINISYNLQMCALRQTLTFLHLPLHGSEIVHYFNCSQFTTLIVLN